jgi:hypothetical protein
MDLDRLILETTFRQLILEPDKDAGLARFEAIVGRAAAEEEFETAVGRLLSRELIYDPVTLPAGALQCHWRLELTPVGVEAVHGYSRLQPKQ